MLDGYWLHILVYASAIPLIDRISDGFVLSNSTLKWYLDGTVVAVHCALYWFENVTIKCYLESRIL